MFPSTYSRQELATGLLLRGMELDGHYLLVTSSDIGMTQEFETEQYVQGGPRTSVVNYGLKTVAGSLSMPLYVSEDNVLDPGIVALLNHAAKPSSALSLKTNYSLSYLGLSADNAGTTGNELLTFDTMVVTKLQITCSPTASVMLNATFLGMIDARDEISYVAPPDEYALQRELSWGDCDMSRLHSAMRAASEFSIDIENSYEAHAFLVPYSSNVRSDQPNLLALKGTKFMASATEVVRIGIDLHTYVHGGSMAGENLVLTIGPASFTYQHPAFKVSQQKIDSGVTKRILTATAQNTPSWNSNDTPFFQVA